MANTQQYIDDYIRQYLLAQEQKKYNSDPINRVQDASSKIDMAGKGLSSLGGLMSKAPISGVNTLGQGMQSFGNALSGGATKVSTALNNLTGNALGSSLGSGALSGSVASGAAGAGASAGAGAAAGGSAAGSGMAAGPMGALVALGIAALKGDKRNAAKQQGQAMLKANEEMNNALMQESEQQQAQNQQQLNNIVNNSNIQPTFTGNNTQMPEDVVNNLQGDYGFMTGGAAPVQNNTSLGYDGSATQYLQENMPRFAGVRENNEVKQGILNKLASGIGDFAQGYQENRNTGFAPENLTNDKIAITKEVPNTQLQDYQQELTNKGYNPEVVNAVSDKKNSGFKEIDNWIKENPQAYNPNTTETTYKPKGNMARAGEFLGSAARIAQNPGVQALLAGGISTALTGNPLYGAGMAYKFGNQRAMSELYRDVLAQNGIQTQEPGIFGNVSSNDMKNIGNMMETKHRNDVWDRYYADKIINDVNELDYKMQKDEEDRKYKAKDYELKVNKYNEDVRHNKAMENKPSEKTNKPKPEDHKNWSKDLSDYLKIKSQYPHNAEAARIDFINEHNVDPEKYLVQKQSNNTNNRFERR